MSGEACLDEKKKKKKKAAKFKVYFSGLEAVCPVDNVTYFPALLFTFFGTVNYFNSHGIEPYGHYFYICCRVKLDPIVSN